MECLVCTLRQAVSVTELLGYGEQDQQQTIRASMRYLANADYSGCTPELMGGLWRILTERSGQKDPYDALKRHCNEEALRALDDARRRIECADDPFFAALRYAIAGNLIDYAMHQTLTPAQQSERIAQLAETPLAIDDSAKLKARLQNAKRLLYICDNAGEIAFDRLNIEFIKKTFPALTVTCGVRGAAVLNDVTIEDARFVGMDEVAQIIDSGDDSAGTVLSRTSQAFRDAFEQADAVIAKGQGNYETLCACGQDKVFFLLMAKCEPVRKAAGVPLGAVVCLQNEARVIEQ